LSNSEEIKRVTNLSTSKEILFRFFWRFTSLL